MCDPYQGMARLAASIVPPGGYEFDHMDRSPTLCKIYFRKI